MFFFLKQKFNQNSKLLDFKIDSLISHNYLASSIFLDSLDELETLQSA
jgi:hypothetical protein